MGYERWGALSVFFFVVAVVFTVMAIAFYFFFDIRQIRKERSGKQVESYMEEYRKKKEQSRHLEIYDPSGKLIADVKNVNVGQEPAGTQPSLADGLARAKQNVVEYEENATQVLNKNARNYSNFVIIKDYVYTSSPNYIA